MIQQLFYFTAVFCTKADWNPRYVWNAIPFCHSTFCRVVSNHSSTLCKLRKPRAGVQGYQKYGENDKLQSGALAIQWTDTRTGNRHFPLIFKLSA